MDANRVSDEERSTLLSFLSDGDRQGYAPQSGDITGNLKWLNAEMSANLAIAQQAEEERKTNHACGARCSDGREIASLTAATNCASAIVLPNRLVTRSRIALQMLWLMSLSSFSKRSPFP